MSTPTGSPRRDPRYDRFVHQCRRIRPLDTPDFGRDVEVVGELAYLADRGSGLRVIDVSNPEAPVELGAFATGGSVGDVPQSMKR